ncbi:MAG: biotin carboxylase, partial [Crocinitomicaceae bacterium]|nr:biotin carboxylase [Crocinitomicaceae bacterium]
FDTNFVKTYLSDIEAIYDGFADETAALQSGINQLWDDLKASNKKQFASHPIITNWVKVP